MQESYLEACLEAGFKTIKNRRLNAVGKCPEYTLMDKPWKELVKLAVLETEIQAKTKMGKPLLHRHVSVAGVVVVANNRPSHLQRISNQ